MSRKPGDGKKVILGRGAIDYDFPPDSVWVSYESKIGRKLQPAARLCIDSLDRRHFGN